MNISAQFFDDILNDATLATTAQGQRIAQAHNDNNAAHSAYDVFRRRPVLRSHDWVLMCARSLSLR